MWLTGGSQKGEWKNLKQLPFWGEISAGSGNGDWETQISNFIWFLFLLLVMYSNLLFFVYECEGKNPFKLLYIICVQKYYDH